jgi:hypothetical protein
MVGCVGSSWDSGVDAGGDGHTYDQNAAAVAAKTKFVWPAVGLGGTIVSWSALGLDGTIVSWSALGLDCTIVSWSALGLGGFILSWSEPAAPFWWPSWTSAFATGAKRAKVASSTNTRATKAGVVVAVLFLRVIPVLLLFTARLAERFCPASDRTLRPAWYRIFCNGVAVSVHDVWSCDTIWCEWQRRRSVLLSMLLLLLLLLLLWLHVHLQALLLPQLSLELGLLTKLHVPLLQVKARSLRKTLPTKCQDRSTVSTCSVGFCKTQVTAGRTVRETASTRKHRLMRSTAARVSAIERLHPVFVRKKRTQTWHTSNAGVAACHSSSNGKRSHP